MLPRRWMVRRSSWEDLEGVFCRKSQTPPPKLTPAAIRSLLGEKLFRAEPEFVAFLRADRTSLELYDWLAKGSAPDAEIDRRRMQVMRLGSTLLRQAAAHVFEDFSDPAYVSELRLWLAGADCHKQAAALWGLCRLGDPLGVKAILFGLERISFFQGHNRGTAYYALCLTAEPQCARVFCRALEQVGKESFIPEADLIDWLARNKRTESVGVICKVLDRLTGAGAWEQKQMMYIAESLGKLGSPEAVPTLWIAYRNLKKAVAPAEYQQPVRDALVVLAGEEVIMDWERKDDE